MVAEQPQQQGFGRFESHFEVWHLHIKGNAEHDQRENHVQCKCCLRVEIEANLVNQNFVSFIMVVLNAFMQIKHQIRIKKNVIFHSQ